MFNKVFDFMGKGIKLVVFGFLISTLGLTIYGIVYYYNNPDKFNQYITTINKQYKLDSLILENQTYYDYKDVPNQREKNGVWVSNPHGLINESEVFQIDTLVKGIEKRTSYEIAVVLLNNISGNTPYDFGLELFNYWGIGKKETNNGLLILVIENQHNLTFVTGTGTELVLTDLMTKKIGDEKMKPFFREQKYAKGLISGITAIGDIFDNKKTGYNNKVSWFNWVKKMLLIYAILLLVLILIYGYFLIKALLIKDLYKRYIYFEKINFSFFKYIFPLPFLWIDDLHVALLYKWKNTIRFSPKQGKVMHKIFGEKKNVFLTDGQVKEIDLFSVNYDVWITNDKSDVLILPYKNKSSRYMKCRECGHKTTTVDWVYNSKYDIYKYNCLFCGNQRTDKTKKSYSGSSGYGSTSSSSGSSWSGGSSSGGGSSSSW